MQMLGSKPQDGQQQAARQQPAHTQKPAAHPAGNFDDFDSDIPFN
jgi:hypothetical protein